MRRGREFESDSDGREVLASVQFLDSVHSVTVHSVTVSR